MPYLRKAILLLALLNPLTLNAQGSAASALFSILSASTEFNNFYNQFLDDFTRAFGHVLVEPLPYFGTLGYDNALSRFSVFGINFSVSTGVIAATGYAEPDDIRPLFFSDERYDEVSNILALPLVRAAPYLALRFKIDPKESDSFIYPLRLSFRYGGTSLIQDNYDQLLQSVTSSLDVSFNATYKIDSYGVNIGFPLWKTYPRNFQLNFSIGYNYSRGEASLGYSNTFDLNQSIDFDRVEYIPQIASDGLITNIIQTNIPTNATIESMSIQYDYRNYFESSTIDFSFTLEGTMRFINIAIGMGLIINSTKSLNRYESIGNFRIEGEEEDFTLNTQNRQDSPTLEITPKIDLSLKIYNVLHIGIGATLDAWGGKIGFTF